MIYELAGNWQGVSRRKFGGVAEKGELCSA